MLSSPASDTQITHGARLWLYGLVGLVFIYLILPCLVVVPMSFSGSQYLEFPPRTFSLRWYEAYLTSPEWLESTVVSIKVAVFTTLIATVLGTAAAYGLFRTRSVMAGAIRSILMLPMLVPVILIAIGTFFVYAKLGLNSTITGLVIAHTMLAVPFVIISVTNGLTGFDLAQERAAQSLGASPVYAFFTVTLPQIKISVLSGMLFAFVASFDEVVVSLYISSGSTSTLTKRIFANIRDQVDPTVAAISSLLVLLSVVVLLTTQMIQARVSRNSGAA